MFTNSAAIYFGFTLATLLSFDDGAKGETKSEVKPAFEFRTVEYFHRYSKDQLHEFTPQGQEDLENWDDMITLNRPDFITDEEKLAGWANTVLANYRSAKGSILRTHSIPKTAEKPAEHFIAVVFVRDNFAECAFARFKMQDGKGINIVYSHRIRSENLVDDLSSWIKEHGAEIEKAILGWDSVPEPVPSEKR